MEAGHKVTICHATSSSNPAQYWELITVDVASSGGRHKLEGHVGHLQKTRKDGRLDVIPSFTYDGVPFVPDGNGPGNGDQWADFVALQPEAADCLGVVTPPPT